MKRKQDQRRKRKTGIRIRNWLFMAVLSAYVCAGCGEETAQEQPVEPGKAGEEAPASGQTESDSLAADSSAMLKAVLLGDARFLYVADGGMEDIAVAEVPGLFDEKDPYMKIWNFAVADLDGDGEEEVILFVSGAAGDMGGKLILHRAGEDIYGYRTDNRTLVELKTDGTYGYSDPTGTAEEGIAAITEFAVPGFGNPDLAAPDFSESDFSEMGFTADKAAYATGTYEGWDLFVVGNETAAEEEYLDAVSRQKEKQDVQWYEFTEENIEKILDF